MDFKVEFEKVARDNIKRDGLESLLSMLATTDFYIAPASTRYHDSEEHGLVKHSLRVFATLSSDLEGMEYDKETIAIVSLFHDICKAGFYKTEMRNTKDEHGKWIQVPYYTVDDKLPLGHGEKSVIMLLTAGFQLNTEEIMAIRWHMGAFEPKETHSSLSKCWNEFSLPVYLHIADLKASYGL